MQRLAEPCGPEASLSAPAASLAYLLPRPRVRPPDPPTSPRSYTAKYALRDPQREDGWWVATKDVNGNVVGEQAESYWLYNGGGPARPVRAGAKHQSQGMAHHQAALRARALARQRPKA
jgi:hypothetical protein